MTNQALLDAIENRTPGYRRMFRLYGRNLDPAEQWVATQLLADRSENSASYEDKSGSGALGALDPLKAVSRLTTTGAATATLANGVEGNFKSLHMVADGGDLVITVANLQGGTTITLNDVNDFVVLQFVSGKWRVVTDTGATIA